jgi:hypothetical protein
MTLTPNDFAGTTFADRWDAMMVALRAGATRRVVVEGDHVLDRGLDLRNLRNRYVFDFGGARLTFAMAGGVAIDCTGSNELTIRDLDARGDADAAPDVGLLLARAGAETSGRHHLDNCRVYGTWGTAALYNVGSEVNRFMGGAYQNLGGAGRYAMYFGRRTRAGDVVPVSYSTTAASATGQFLIGVHCRAGDCTEGGLYVYGFQNIATEGIYCTGYAAPHVVVDSSQDAVYGLRLLGLYTHPDADELGALQSPDVSVQIEASSKSVNGFRLEALRLAATEAEINIGDVVMQAAVIDLPEAGGAGLACASGAQLVDSAIRANGSVSAPKPVALGAVFSGQITLGKTSQLTPAAAMRGTVHFTQAGGHDRVRHYSPVGIAPAAAHGPESGEALIAFDGEDVSARTAAIAVVMAAL